MDIKNKYIKDISGGQKQRVAIDSILVLDSDLLLFDEPSSALDAMTKDNFQNTLLEVFKKYDVTSVIVTHDIEEAVLLGQKIVIMNDGVITDIINNYELYGKVEGKKSLSFYEKCIELRKRLE